MINQLQQLAYLDDRPVFQEERRAAKAWGEGGLTAERKAKEDMRNVCV